MFNWWFCRFCKLLMVLFVYDFWLLEFPISFEVFVLVFFLPNLLYIFIRAVLNYCSDYEIENDIVSESAFEQFSVPAGKLFRSVSWSTLSWVIAYGNSSSSFSESKFSYGFNGFTTRWSHAFGATVMISSHSSSGDSFLNTFYVF